jgi:outer membrane receptor protein involved in Fe transport
MISTCRDSLHTNSRPIVRIGLGLLALTFLLPAVAGALSVELEARYWAVSFDGTVRPAILEEELALDLGADFGLDADNALEGRFTFRPGLGIFLRAAYLTLSADGSRSFDLDLENLPIDLSAAFDGALDFEHARLALGWQFVAPKKTLRIGPYVEAKGLSGDASLAVDAEVLRETFSEDFEGVFGALGALFELQPTSSFGLFADLSVLVGEDDADWTDFEAGLRYYPIDILGIGAGYRILEIDGKIDDVLIDIEYDGFFVTAQLRF